MVFAVGSTACAAPPSANPAPAPVGHGPTEQSGSYGAYFETVRTWPAAEAGQAAAVDGEHFYAIVNTKIGKYDKATGERVGGWEASEEYPVTHMNGGYVHNVHMPPPHRLFVANSTFPRVPSASSIELFSVNDYRVPTFVNPMLDHLDSYSLGPVDGSLTWIDRNPAYMDFPRYGSKRTGEVFACFVHYTENVEWTSRETSWTRLSRMTTMFTFKEQESWLFPRTLVEKFEPHSCSGGSFGPDGRLYVTGHDLGEVYVVELPKAGPILKHVATLPAPGITGQGIAWDRTATAEDGSPLLYGINRPDRAVVVMKLVNGGRIGEAAFANE